jgi:hypothetical protein
MRKLARSSLVVALLGLPLGLVTTGCSDDAGGNEAGVMDKTQGGKGTVGPDAPKEPEDYYKSHSEAKKK